MIRVHRLNGEEFILNAHHIEIMEEKPDTVITLTNDRKYIVKESVNEIIALIESNQKPGLTGNGMNPDIPESDD